MTATKSGRLLRSAGMLVGLLTAFVLMMGLTSKDADAFTVQNPGTFTMSFTNGSGDGIRFSNGSISETRWPFNAITNPSPPSFPITVNADGTFTANTSSLAFQTKQIHNSCLTGAFLCVGEPQGVKSTPEPGGTWSGQINPETGAVTMAMPMRIRNESVSTGVGGSAITDCYIGGAEYGPIDIQPATGKANGAAYNYVNGSARLADAGWTTPVPRGLNGGSGSGRCDRTNNHNTPMNLPSADTWFRANVSILNSSGDAVRLFPKPTFTVSQNPVGEGDNVTLDASGSEMGTYLQECADPSPAEAGCGYRWDFNNDGVDDEVTNAPTVETSYPAAGSVTAKLTIFSNLGKNESTTRAITVQVHPVAQIDSTPPSVTKETSNTFTFSIPTNPYGATTQCSIDGGAFAACDSGDAFTFNQTDDQSGSHQFRVRGITPGGVAGPAASHTFTIDRVKPRVTIAPASRPANPTNVTSAAFTFTADKPGSTLECQLDGGAWVACGTNSTGSQSYNGLNENPSPHEFRIRATDTLGNVGGGGNPGGGAYDWRVDLTAPVPTFVDKPANPSNVVSPLITWSSDEPIQLAQCRLKVDGVTGPWAACDSLTSKQYTDLADDNYEFAIRVLDIAGNWSNILAHPWLLETVSPNLEITSGPPALSNRSLAQFFYDYEPGATLTCQLDSRPVQDPCPSGIKYAYIAEGSHLFTVTATDAALNSTTKTYTWSSKTIQPVVQINAGSVPASSSTVNTADFELATANGDAECRIDGSDWEACDSDEGQSYTDLADGNHTFEVRAVDSYGNVSPIDAYSWLVATAAPEVTFTSTPLENTRESTAFFGFDVTSADADVIAECSLDGTEPFVCSDETALVNLEDGDHNFTVTATDTAGIQGVASFDWNVKAKIPGLGFDSVPSSLSDSADATFEFSSDEDPDVAYDCQLDGGSWDTCASPVSKSGLGQGSHSFSIRATDSVGNTAVETYDWKVDTVAPSVTFGSKPAASTVDIAELISFSASETGVTYECSFDNAAFAACTSPALLRNLATGAHSFRVKATDEAGNEGAVATASWTRGLPAPPSVTAAPAAITGVTAKVGSGALSGSAPLSKATKAKNKKKKAKKAAKKNAKKASKNVKKAKGKR